MSSKRKNSHVVYLLIFFLVYLFFNGIASFAEQRKKTDNISDVATQAPPSLKGIQSALCFFNSDAELDRDLEKFIETMRELKNSKYLEDWLLNTNIDEIKDFSKQLEGCKPNIELMAIKNPDLRKQVDDWKLKIDRVIGGIKRLLGFIELEELLRKELDELKPGMQNASSLHLKRTEWPPASSCSQCEEYWLILEKITGYKWEKYPENYLTLGDLLKNIALLKARKAEICCLINQLNQIDLNKIDEDYQYYSWTETRKAIGKILAHLNDERVREICQIH